MTDPKCVRPSCSLKSPRGGFCKYCQTKITSTMSQIALAQHRPVTVEQRCWVYNWFLITTYFAYHKRMSRGRAKRLLDAMPQDIRGGCEPNPANVEQYRGPHDPVTDAAPQTFRFAIDHPFITWHEVGDQSTWVPFLS